MFKELRRQIRNFVWHFEPQHFSSMERGYESRAEFPKSEILKGLLGYIGGYSGIRFCAWKITATNVDPTNLPLIYNVIAFASFAALFVSTMWIAFFVYEFLKGQIELSIFKEEYIERLKTLTQVQRKGVS